MEQYVKRILTSSVYDAVSETPLDEMQALGRRLNNKIFVKREDLNPVFSFKIRGAYNKMAHLNPARIRNGVIAASAGNHAQGVAYAANRLKIHAIIIMPVTTPHIKLQAVRRLGGAFVEVQLHGDRFDDALGLALTMAKQKHKTFITPYDDPDIIAGQGTIGMELLRQIKGPLHAVFLPVGGGGLAAGISAYIKYLRPDVKCIAVESEDAASFQAARQAGRRVRLKNTGIFADGVSVAQVGAEPFKLLKNTIDDAVTATNDEMCAAIKDLFEDTRSIAEPSGALGLAGLKKYVAEHNLRNQTLITINTGANVNFDRLRYVSERYEVGEQKEALLAVVISEEPGSLTRLCDALDGFDISELNFRYTGLNEASVFIGVRLAHGHSERARLVKSMHRRNFTVEDMSGNELAKQHVAHMVGGHGHDGRREELVSFQFPERPGILREFLTVMQGRWNISLFHYRRDGGSYANVLIGLQEIPGKKYSIRKFMREFGYPSTIETANPAYRLFLQ